MASDQSGTSAGSVPWRHHQTEALKALEAAAKAGQKRCWVVLPPGPGRTVIALEHARRLGRPIVVFSPNTAAQQQWLQAWPHLPNVSKRQATSTNPDLGAHLTSLTYEGLSEAPLARGQVTVILDDCHHLLQDREPLLREVLELFGDVRVVGVTATPPELLAEQESALVAELFGGITYAASIPELVADGDLAPFVELAWFTAPSATEIDWLARDSHRFDQLITVLTSQLSGTMPLLSWVDLRFVRNEVDAAGRPKSGAGWAELVRSDPAVADAVLRLHHGAWCDLPEGAVVGEAHRRAPTVADWMLVIDDWVTHGLSTTLSAEDEMQIELLKATLPSVGYQWTPEGIRRGVAAADQVMARSDAKVEAAAALITRMLSDGPAVNWLVLCDVERTASLPEGLELTLAEESGSAQRVLDVLVAQPGMASARPLLVTGTRIGGPEAVLTDLLDFCRAADPGLAASVTIAPVEGHPWAEVTGWTSDTWLTLVGRWFRADTPTVLVGTGALLGEGWDARGITGVIDLTSATDTAAIVSTRTRSLQLDPERPDKVAITWTITSLFDQHPLGDADYQRCVRKHADWFALDEAGDVVDGVAHLDNALSPHVPPRQDDVAGLNQRALARALNLDAVAAAWGRFDPGPHRVLATLDVRDVCTNVLGRSDTPRPVLVSDKALRPAGPRSPIDLAVQAAFLVTVVLGILINQPLLLAVSLAGLLGHAYVYGKDLLEEGAAPPSLSQLGSAVAQSLYQTNQIEVDAEAVHVEPTTAGGYRCSLQGATSADSELFATSLDELVQPLDRPRYLVSRWRVRPGKIGPLRSALAGWGFGHGDERVWWPVPTAMGGSRDQADIFAKAFQKWVGGNGETVVTGTAEGAALLATQRGRDPLGMTSGAHSLLRRRLEVEPDPAG